MRVMLDTNVYDALVAHPAALELVKRLIAAGKLMIITTHIQRDQLAAIPQAEKRDAVLAIPTDRISTSGAIWGLSRWGQAKWGDREVNSGLGRMTGGNPKHAADALIGVTASSGADALVTNDKQLAARGRATYPKLPIWSFAEFVDLIEAV